MTLHSGSVNVDTVEVDPVFGATGSFLTITLTIGSGGSGGGGVTDHGDLTGLGDDDHTQYLTTGRGDARYDALGDADAAQSAAEATAAGALSAHSADTTGVHGIADTSVLETVTGSQAKVDAHTGDPSAAHAASAIGFTPTGTLAATDVQAALAEAASEAAAAVATEITARDAAIAAAIALLINSAPGLLDTLDEIAAALGDDPNFAATMTTALAGKQPLDAELTALAGLVSTANKLPYFSGSGTATMADFTAFARTLLDDADATAARATLGLVIGTDVQGFDPDLAAIAALASAANKLAYATGSGTWSLTDLSAFARTLLDDGDAATMRATLGVDATGTAVLKTLYDANSILIATTDDTPVALTVAASRIVGRKATGDIVALTAAELKTILALAAGDVAFTPTGTIAATDVQSAIAEVASEAGSGASPWFIQIINTPNAFTSKVGTWGHFDSGSQWFGHLLYNTTGAQNDEANWDLLIAAGTWAIDVVYQRDGTRAIATFQIDDGAGTFTTAGTIDMFGSTANNVEASVTGITVSGSAVKRRFKMKAATKNASSSAYYMAAQAIQLRRTV